MMTDMWFLAWVHQSNWHRLMCDDCVRERMKEPTKSPSQEGWYGIDEHDEFDTPQNCHGCECDLGLTVVRYA